MNPVLAQLPKFSESYYTFTHSMYPWDYQNSFIPVHVFIQLIQVSTVFMILKALIFTPCLELHSNFDIKLENRKKEKT